MYQRYTELQSFIRREHFKVWGEWVRTKEGFGMCSGCPKSNSAALDLTEFFFTFSLLCWGRGEPRYACATAHVWLDMWTGPHM